MALFIFYRTVKFWHQEKQSLAKTDLSFGKLNASELIKERFYHS